MYFSIVFLCLSFINNDDTYNLIVFESILIVRDDTDNKYTFITEDKNCGKIGLKALRSYFP